MTDRTVVYRLQAEATQFKAQMAAAGASVKKAADDMTGATREGAKFRQGLDSLGGAAGKVGLVAAAGLGAAVLKAADFDQSMSKVQAATHESAAAMDSLRQAALDAGADTAFSATEAAAGIENLAKAGVSTADILDGGLAGALDLAAAGEMEVADAAEAAAGAMAQFKLDGDQATHVADLLAAGAGKAQGDVSDMVMALKQAGTVSAQTGLSLEETTGTLAAMAEQSLLGSDAGTSFKTMLSSLTPNSKAASDAMAAYNIHAFDAQGNFVGMTALAGQLRDGLSGLTDEQRAMALETIFGSDAVRAASIVYDNGAEGIADWTAKVNDAGYAAETAAIKQDNLRGDIEKLGGALETALIGTGSSSQGPLRSFTQSLEDAVNGYNSLGDGAKAGVAVTLGATAALGGGLFVFSKLVQGIANTREALSNLGVKAGTTSKALQAVGKGVEFFALVESINLLDGAMDNLLNTSIESSSLTRDLESLANGQTNTELEKLGKNLAYLDTFSATKTDKVFGFLPGATESDRAMENIRAIDEALAGMVESGNADMAADALAEITGSAEKLGAEDPARRFTEYNKALENTAAAAAKSVAPQVAAADASSNLGAAAFKSAEQIKAEEEALQDARDAARGTAQQFVNLGNSLNDGKKSLGQWLNEMSKQADALNNFTTNAERAANRGLRRGLIDALREAGPEGALRMKQLANATDAEIDRANRSWAKGQKAINDYVAATTRVPANKTTNLFVDASDSLAKIAAVKNSITSLRDRNLTITTVYKVVRSATDALPARAEGGAIYGPGTATSDSIPAWLSNGEYVVKAEAVEKYGVHMFDRLNAMHFAEGGPVDGGKDKEKRKPVAVVVPEGGWRDWLEAMREQKKAAKDQLVAATSLAETAKTESDTAQQNHDTAKATRDQMAATIASAFRSDLWAKPDNIWSGAAMDPFSILAQDTANATAFSGATTSLAARGLDGAAFNEILGSGDLSRAQWAQSLSDADLQRFETMFNARETAALGAGKVASDIRYGAEIAALAANAAQQLAEAKIANQNLAAVTNRLERVESAIEFGSEKLDSVAAKAGRNGRGPRR